MATAPKLGPSVVSRRASPAPRPRPAVPSRRPARTSRRRPLAFLVFSAFVVGTLVLGLTAINAVVTQGSFRFQDLSDRAAALEQQLQVQRLELARLTAPGRIAEAARRLGLVLPDPTQVQILHVDGKQVVGGRP